MEVHVEARGLMLCRFLYSHRLHIMSNFRLLSEMVKKAFVAHREYFCDDGKGKEKEKNIRCKFHGENILWS
jgi:hypothetical protein